MVRISLPPRQWMLIVASAVAVAMPMLVFAGEELDRQNAAAEAREEADVLDRLDKIHKEMNDQWAQENGRATRQAFEQYAKARQDVNDEIAQLRKEKSDCGACPKREEINRKLEAAIARRDAIVGSVAPFMRIFGLAPPSHRNASPFAIADALNHEPPEVKNGPAFCKPFYDEYAICNAKSQDSRGPWQDAQCEDLHKSYGLCLGNDKKAFLDQLARMKKREAGEEQFTSHHYRIGTDVTYFNATEDTAYVLPKALDGADRLFTVNTGRHGMDALASIVVHSMFGELSVAYSEPSEFRSPWSEMLQADFSEVATARLLFLRCTYDDGDQATSFEYWYLRAPPAELAKKWRNHLVDHPLLRVLRPRSTCPKNLAEAEQVLNKEVPPRKFAPEFLEALKR